MIDVEAVRLDVDGDDLGAEFPQRRRRDLVAGAIGAIHDDSQARQRHRAGQRALGELDVAIMNAVDTLGAAETIRIGQRHVDIVVEHRFDTPFDLVRKLVAVGAEKLDAVVEIGIVGGRDHDADVGAQRADEHGDRRSWDGAEQEHVHAGGGKARHHGILDHVTGEPGVLAEHDAVTMVAALKRQAGGHADLHRHFRRHRKGVRLAANAVRSEIASCHGSPLFKPICGDSCHRTRRPTHHIW